jgi:predicted pyridoxine 5'-phosphate oxidase superfamily flavin-nucleotide-binding protein
MQERIFVGQRQMPAAVGTQLGTELTAAQKEQISGADTFFIATDNPEHGAHVSHKGGNPGFVKIIDERHIAYPDYNGNSMFNTLGNLTVDAHAGLLFIDFESGRTLQLTGRASIDWSPERVRNFAGAERVVDFELDQIIDTPAGFPLLAKFRQYSRTNPKGK